MATRSATFAGWFTCGSGLKLDVVEQGVMLGVRIAAPELGHIALNEYAELHCRCPFSPTEAPLPREAPLTCSLQPITTGFTGLPLAPVTLSGPTTKRPS